MKNKGFTLIELLAVIVILAIIALIATPIILGIIDDAGKGAKDSSAQMIVDNIELAYSTAYINAKGVAPKLSQVAAAFKMDGFTMANDGTITADTQHAGQVKDCAASVSGTTLTGSCTPDYEGSTAVTTSSNSVMTITPES